MTRSSYPGFMLFVHFLGCSLFILSCNCIPPHYGYRTLQVIIDSLPSFLHNVYIYMQYIQNIQKHYSTCLRYEVFFHIEGTIQIYSISFASDFGDSLGLRLVGVTDPIDIQLALIAMRYI